MLSTMPGARITHESTRQLRQFVERHRMVNALHEHLVDGDLAPETRARYLTQLEAIVSESATLLAGA